MISLIMPFRKIKSVLILLIGLVIVVTIVGLIFGFFLILFPVVAILLIIGYVFRKLNLIKKAKPIKEKKDKSIIEAEYKVKE